MYKKYIKIFICTKILYLSAY